MTVPAIQLLSRCDATSSCTLLHLVQDEVASHLGQNCIASTIIWYFLIYSDLNLAILDRICHHNFGMYMPLGQIEHTWSVTTLLLKTCRNDVCPSIVSRPYSAISFVYRRIYMGQSIKMRSPWFPHRRICLYAMLTWCTKLGSHLRYGLEIILITCFRRPFSRILTRIPCFRNYFQAVCRVF